MSVRGAASTLFAVGGFSFKLTILDDLRRDLNFENHKAGALNAPSAYSLPLNPGRHAPCEMKLEDALIYEKPKR
jgi:hypothetical protein